MNIHILGICGTFMAGLALLARALGHKVSGSDSHVYPPMSTQLEAAGIEVMEGYLAEHLAPRPDAPAPDRVVVGNAMTRGLPAVEYLLNQDIPFTSGPAWLAEQVLRGRWVLAVAGTHGKTTSSSMLAWMLQWAGLEPGFLIGGIPADFGLSARLGRTPFFVVEADEYDSAFFDKRSKFVHYRARTLILNNLEFDHADIFPDLAAIQKQFHHLVRTIPGQGLIISNGSDTALEAVLDQGCWTPVERFVNGDWRARVLAADGSAFDVYYQGQRQGRVGWSQIGMHNVHNALAALAAARHVGIPPTQAIQALNAFTGVKRRLERCGVVNDITVYDDFAHHPTAIAATLQGLRALVKQKRIIAVLEPRSNTMRMGQFKDSLVAALTAADKIVFYQAADLAWQAEEVLADLGRRGQVCRSIEAVIATVCATARPDDQVLIMSNGNFGGIHQRLLRALAAGGS